MVERIFGQDRILRGLKNALHTQRLHSGLLFLGPEQVGRETTARWLARALLCESPVDDEGCQECRSCKRVTSGNHPDLHLVLSEAEAIERGISSTGSTKTPSRAIVVETIRNLNQRLLMRPYEGKASVAIIPNAHEMHPSAANAFLKTLEEPPPNTYMILLAPHARSVLDTIASRCMSIQFSPLSAQARGDIQNQLEARGGALPLEADDRAYSRTPSSANSESDEGTELIHQALTLLSQPGTGEFLDLVEAIGKDRQQAILFLQSLTHAAGQQLRQEVMLPAEQQAPVNTHLSRDALCRIMELGFSGIASLQRNAQVQVTLEEFFVRAAA